MTEPAAATRTRRTDYIRDFDGDPAPPASRPAGPAPSYDAHVDRGVADAVWNRASPQPHGDGILYVGMNQTSASAELGALTEATHGNVISILGRAGAAIETKFGTFDLTDDAQVHAFADGVVKHYGLSKDAGARLESLLLSVTAHDKQGRDELGKIALYMARAESGGTPMPSRLVLSGHSTAGNLYGEAADGTHLGKFALDDVRELGRIFPAAAKQVEDIHFGSCFSNAQIEKNEAWREVFPNLKTMWGYARFSAGAPVGDMKAWELASRGHVDRFSVGALSPYANPNGHVTGWSAKGGVSDPSIDVTTLRSNVSKADAHFDALVSGQTRIAKPEDSPAHEDYAAYRDLAGRSATSSLERAQLNHRADVLFRVRFYETGVRSGFQKAYGAEIGRAFSALGLDVPDWATLSRQDAMAKIDDFRRAAGTPPPPAYADAARHLEALASLDPGVISEDWCRR